VLPLPSLTNPASVDCVDLESSNREFDAHHSLVRKYFYRQLKDIDAMWENVRDDESYRTNLKWKRAVWKDTQRLADLESTTSHIYHVMCVLAFSCIYATATATLMNIIDTRYAVAGGFMLSFQAFIGICGWAISIRAADVRDCGRILEQIRARVRPKAGRFVEEGNVIDAERCSGPH
jgi:hypothetical protein